jgi:hypothetical protein
LRRTIRLAALLLVARLGAMVQIIMRKVAKLAIVLNKTQPMFSRAGLNRPVSRECFSTKGKKMKKTNDVVKTPRKVTLKKKKISVKTPNYGGTFSVKSSGSVPKTNAQSYKEIVKNSILQHLRSVLSPNYFMDSLQDYAQMFPGEDVESVCQMVVEDIKREAKNLIKQIQSLRF